MKVNPLVILVICVVLSGAKYILVKTKDKTPSAHDDDMAKGGEREPLSDDYGCHHFGCYCNGISRCPEPHPPTFDWWKLRGSLVGKIKENIFHKIFILEGTIMVLL